MESKKIFSLFIYFLFLFFISRTTTINLLCRLYDAMKGEIKIDGENIKNYKYDSLMSHIGVVPQDT